MNDGSGAVAEPASGGALMATAPQRDRPLFTKKSLCAYLGVSQSTLDRLVSAGQLISCRIGGQVRFRPDDVEAFIAANQGVDR